MADLKWFARRLSAMSPPEIAWRVEQRLRQQTEERRFRVKQPVTRAVFRPDRIRPELAGDTDPARLFRAEKMALNLENGKYSLCTAIPLLSPYAYDDYRMRWHAGFQTPNEWPLVPSGHLDFRGMDAVGDARTNWELNKHFQFALLAKDYYAGKDRRYLEELKLLFEDWNEKNPFLWGISWTSGIEIAERTLNWCAMLAFLKASPDVPGVLLTQAATGILNMADWLFHHYSRYSSANNHLLIEISAVLHAGVLFDVPRWRDRAVEILSRELILQDHPDGVNREEALYYQAFMMEAYALDLRLLKKNGIAAAQTAAWEPMLQKMTRYVRTCIGKYGEVVEFGDNDDGKLLDLSGCADGRMPEDSGRQHYAYLLQMMSLLLPERTALPGSMDAGAAEDGDAGSLPCETVCWLFTEEECIGALEKPLFEPADSTDYKEGGNAVLRSPDGEILIGIDHAPLGYGSLCAHGHADALSFVVFTGGRPLLADPGTYIYHTDEEARNDFRRTARHNTVCVGGRDQSEMLGAFLWGKKANCRLLSSEITDGRDVIEAEHDGYAPVLHRRRFVFDKETRILTLEDHVGEAKDAVFHLLFAPNVRVERSSDSPDEEIWRCGDAATGRELAEIRFVSGFCDVRTVDREISRVYGVKEQTGGLEATITGGSSVCEIRLRPDKGED